MGRKVSLLWYTRKYSRRSNLRPGTSARLSKTHYLLAFGPIVLMQIVTGILFSFPADWRRQILKIVLVLDCNWLLWAVTLAVFFGWRQIFLALKHPLLHPILWATLVVVLLLALSRYPVTAYRERSA